MDTERPQRPHRPFIPRSGQHHRLGPFHGVTVHIERTFAAGMLVVLPIGVTILVLKFFFNLLSPIVEPELRYLPGPDIPGLGIVGLIILVYLAGLVTSHVIGRSVVNLAHRMMEVIPVVKSIYGTTRTAVELLSTPKDHPYSGVVLIQFPHTGLQSIGLVTSRMEGHDGEELLAVYVPTTPIPSSGFLVIARSQDVIPTDISVDDAMKMVVSGGILAGRVFQHHGLSSRNRHNSSTQP